MTKEKLIKAFKKEFGEEPKLIVRAPGRVNLIGEHTDYNDGFVLPMAIERYVWIALRPRLDKKIRLYSLNNDEWVEFELSNIEKDSGWLEYIKGVAHELLAKGYRLNGWEGIIYGNIPQGAGLSSSAALELVTARAFAELSDIEWLGKEMALLGQRVENDWLGLSSGIMDQLVIATAKKDRASLIDCRSLDVEYYPLKKATVIIMDTNTRRGLVDSKYNKRFNQCKTAAKELGIKALRDISLKDFEEKADKLDDLTMRRARHVIAENERTIKAAKALEDSNFELFGKLMIRSHESLRDDFEVSSDTLNAIVECAIEQESCYGARMTGAGFGGCAVALVEEDKVDYFKEKILRCYKNKTNLQAKIYMTKACDGVSAYIVAPCD